jgi:hypothetical protein
MPSGPLEHHLPIPLFPLCRQNTSAIRDRQRCPCDTLIYLLRFLRFLRFLRSTLSLKTVEWWGRWLDQAKDAPARSKSSNRLRSLCSTRLDINGLFAQVLAPMRRETYVPGTRKVITRVREPSVHAQPSQAAAQEAYKAQEGASMAFLITGSFGLTRMPLWRIELAPVPGLSNVATPTNAIITIPITLYGYGNGDDT